MNTNQKMFLIGEVAKALGITRRIILNYEDCGLIKPDKKSGSAGNRYYTIDTLTQIRTIRLFQDSGLSLDEIRRYFDGTIDLLSVIKRLEKMRDELNLNIEKLYERTKEKSDSIKKTHTEAHRIYRRIYSTESVEEKTILLRNTALEAISAYGTDTTQRFYFIEYSVDSPSDVSFCVGIPPESKGEYVETTAAEETICLYHHGTYEKIPHVVPLLLDYARDNNLKIKGTIRHVYLEGPPQHKDPSKFITQVVLPIQS